MHPLTRSFLLVLPVLMVQAIAQTTTFPNTVIAQNDAAAYLKPFPASGVVPLAVIAGDFAANETAATGKYNGQRITVIGRVAAIGQGSSENKVMVVTLQDAAAKQPAVKGEFLFGSIPENSEIQISSDGSMATLVRRDRTGVILSQEPYLSVDQRVGLKGDFKELKVGDIVLTACKLVPKSKLHEIEQAQ
ncbi:MAG: hypothetical protein WCO97_11065 [bacterium]